MAAIPMAISLLERLLVISPQEIGASASHQQSKAEVVIVNANTTNRVTYTGSFMDEAIHAWKTQLYEAVLTYADEDFTADISSDIPNLEAVLKELGISKVDDLEGHKIRVKGKKSHLRMEGFVSDRSGPDRGNDSAAAQAQGMAIASINQNPLVAQIVDPESVLEAIEENAKLAGAQDDFKIRTKKEAVVANQVAEIGKQIQAAAVAEAVDTVNKTVAKPAAEAVAQHTQEIQQNAEHIAAVAQIVDKLQQIVMSASQAPPLPPPNAIDPATINANPIPSPVVEQVGGPVQMD